MADYKFIDNDLVLTITMDDQPIANWPKGDVSLSLHGDSLDVEYGHERVRVPYAECSDPSESNVDDLRVSVLDILNNVPSSGGGGTPSTQTSKIEVVTADFGTPTANDYTNVLLSGRSIIVFAGGTKLEPGTDFTFSGTTITLPTGPQDITIILL